MRYLGCKIGINIPPYLLDSFAIALYNKEIDILGYKTASYGKKDYQWWEGLYVYVCIYLAIYLCVYIDPFKWQSMRSRQTNRT